MKRLWLEWEGNNATGIWEGRIWDVELEESFTGSTFWGVNLKAGDEILRLIAGDWDQDHGNNPLWIDCYKVLQWENLDEAIRHTVPPVVVDVGQAAVDFFHSEIRENGIRHHIFPPEPVTTAAEERARQLMSMAGTMDDILQGVRRMQEAGRVVARVSEAAEFMAVQSSPRIIMDMEVR